MKQNDYFIRNMYNIMNKIQKRFFLFLCFCIPSRILLVYIAKVMPLVYLPILGYITLIIATSFTYIFLSGSRKRGLETIGEKIWWNDLRPLHSFLYYWFSWTILFGNKKEAWKILLGDVFIYSLLQKLNIPVLRWRRRVK